MADASLLTTALIAGMIAAFNPCGFAMLPAYLAYFVGSSDHEETNPAKNIFRAIIVGLTMSLSFILLFGIFGALASSVISQGTVEKQVQWATFILGFLIVPLGIWMIAGKEINLRLPRLNRGGKSTNLLSIFLFGISFAVVSLGCTAPVFFATVIGSFSSDGWFAGTQVFITYGAGMSLVVLALTLATGIARGEVARLMKKLLPHIGKISGVFLVFTGIFLAIYGWWEIQVQRGNVDTNWLIDQSEDFRVSVSNWVSDVGATKLAIVIALWILGIVAWAATASPPKQEPSEKESAELVDYKTWRYSIVGSLILTWLVLEIFRYDWELMILPVYRTIVDLPSRIWGWMSDPFRWSVLFEFLLALFTAAVLFLRIKSRMRASKNNGASTNYSSSSSSSSQSISQSSSQSTSQSTSA